MAECLSAQSYLQGQVIKHCKSWECLEGPPSLEQLVDEHKKFRLMHYDASAVGLLHVMEVETIEDDLFHLKEEIDEVVKEEGLVLDERPEYGEVVLAPNPDDGNEYGRAIVREVENVEYLVEVKRGEKPKLVRSSVLVYFVDFGGEHKVSVKELKPVTKAVMKFPTLCHTVALFEKVEIEGEFVDSRPFKGELILGKKVKFYLDSLKEKETDFFLNLEVPQIDRRGNRSSRNGKIYKFPPVFVTYFAGGERTVLTDKLERLKYWEWELLYSTASSLLEVDDDFIGTNGAFKGMAAELVFSTFELDPGTEFTAQVSRVTKSTSPRGKYAELRLIKLNHPMHCNYHRVLLDQVGRYMTLVDKSRFYPAINDSFWFKLDAKDQYSKLVKPLALGKWCRALKVKSNEIYLIDWDDYIPMRGLDTDDYEMRPLYWEFFQVPALAISICPLEDEVPILLEEGKELFQRGKRYLFRVAHIHPDDNIYEVEYLKSESAAETYHEYVPGYAIPAGEQEEKDEDPTKPPSTASTSSTSTSVTTTSSTTSGSERDELDLAKHEEVAENLLYWKYGSDIDSMFSDPEH